MWKHARKKHTGKEVSKEKRSTQRNHEEINKDEKLNFLNQTRFGIIHQGL
jgi:hypothetical protein